MENSESKPASTKLILLSRKIEDIFSSQSTTSVYDLNHLLADIYKDGITHIEVLSVMLNSFPSEIRDEVIQRIGKLNPEEEKIIKDLIAPED